MDSKLSQTSEARMDKKTCRTKVKEKQKIEKTEESLEKNTLDSSKNFSKFRCMCFHVFKCAMIFIFLNRLIFLAPFLCYMWGNWMVRVPVSKLRGMLV